MLKIETSVRSTSYDNAVCKRVNKTFYLYITLPPGYLVYVNVKSPNLVEQ